MQIVTKFLVIVALVAASAIATPAAEPETDVQCIHGTAPHCTNPIMQIISKVLIFVAAFAAAVAATPAAPHPEELCVGGPPHCLPPV
ncbi:hypothetical protein BC628DRAFT_1423293 [Trametes gibbosa]|nr:hypothetical protein BC628DRAFT_1423293 [Trametes gibbosa]